MFTSRKVIRLHQARGEIFGITADNEYIYYTVSTKHVWRITKTKLNDLLLLLSHSNGCQFRSLVWNGDHDLYVCASSGDEIVGYNTVKSTCVRIGTTVRGYKDGPGNCSQFYFPCGINIDKNGDIYVTDLHHIRKFTVTTKNVETIAGCSTGYKFGGHQDGKVTQAKFDMPCGVAISGDNTMYVADLNNHCIRQIKNGIVATIAGVPGVSGHQDGPMDTALFNSPCGIQLDDRGDLLVCDKNHPVRKIYLSSKTVSSLKIQGVLLPESRSCLCLDTDGGIIFSVGRSLYKWRTVWKLERFLWLGHTKEDASYCHLAKLPKDIIHEIIGHLYG